VFRSAAVMASDDEGAIAPPTHRGGAHGAHGAHGAEVDDVFSADYLLCVTCTFSRWQPPGKEHHAWIEFLGG
jgi:hypothetical protein